MRLVILGTKNVCNQMKQIISQQIDSINIDTYSSIEDFVENTTIRTIKYDRMIFVSNVISKSFNTKQKEQQLNGLLDYLARRMPEMRIVTMCRDSDDYNMYRSIFNVPIYANADISKGLNANLIMLAVESELSTLKTQLEGSEELGVSTISQTIEQKKPEEQEVVAEIEENKKEKKEKVGILKRLFGGGKRKDKKNNKEENNGESKEQIVSNGDGSNINYDNAGNANVDNANADSANVDNVNNVNNDNKDESLKFEIPKFDDDTFSDIDVPVVKSIKQVDDRKKFNVEKEESIKKEETGVDENKKIEKTGVKYEAKKKVLVPEDDIEAEENNINERKIESNRTPINRLADTKHEQQGSDRTPINRLADTKHEQQGSDRLPANKIDMSSEVIINPMTGKPIFIGDKKKSEMKDSDIDDFMNNIGTPKKVVTQTTLPSINFDTKRVDNTVIDDDNKKTKSGVTIIETNKKDNDEDEAELELFSSSKRHNKKSETSNIESVEFKAGVKAPDVIIDDDDEIIEAGVKVVGNKKKDDNNIEMPVINRSVMNINNKNKPDVSSAKFNVKNTGPNYTVDTSELNDVKAGVNKINTNKKEENNDDFEAAFVKKDYRRRQSSNHGDIGLLPTFDDIDIADTSNDTNDITEDEDFDIDVDSAYMQPVSGGQPKVIEKVVERVVEKPVEIIKEVEKRVEVPVEKVVEKEVVKEKTVFVSGGSSQAHTFKQIMSKKEPIYLLVTGDRRSGVTTTALSFANIFGSQMKTLYVDLDTETHGSIIRLGIMDIIEEPDSIQDGLKNLRSPKGLKHLVYWGNNKFGSLITNFDTEITDEEITRATNAIAVQQDFNLVVIDCPFSKLGLLDDILPECDTIICMDGSAQSVINTMSLLNELSDYGVPKKVQNMMFRSARILITEKDIKQKEVKENMEFVNDIFKLTDEPIPWINTPVMGFMDNFVKAVKNM